MLPKLIFVHVPKTAGMTFNNILQQLYKDKFIRLEEDEYLCGRDIKPKIVYYNSYDLISGHFNVDKYDHADRITFVRDPVERVISHYYYIKKQNSKYSAPFPGRFAFADGLWSGGLTLLEFAEKRQNFATNYTGIDPSKFKFIGIQERFNESLKKFEDLIGRKINFDYSNEFVNNKKGEVEEDIKQKIRDINKIDYKFYNKVLINF